jgi:integrase
MRKNYKPAKIYRGKNGDVNEKWFVYYSYINPSTEAYERIKVYEGINEYKDIAEKEKFANDLAKEVNRNLVAGYNPFEVEQIEKSIVQEVTADIFMQENPKSPLLTDAFREFMTSRHERGLEPNTINAYKGFLGKFENYLDQHQLLDVRMDQLDVKLIKDMLSWLHVQHEWNGTTYNNHLDNWGILLNWFAKKPRYWVKREEFSLGKEGEIEHKNSKPMKNQYFGENIAEKVKAMLKDYPALQFFHKFIYFSCMRPDEIRNLKIENVDIKGRYIKIIGKTSSRTVPVCDELAEMLTSLNLDAYPANYYVIGKMGKVSPEMHSENWFSKMFREEIRKPLGISENFKPYGWKHTRVVDLLNAGYSDAEIMNLTGHRDTASYDTYKRELVNHIQTRLRGKTIGWKD